MQWKGPARNHSAECSHVNRGAVLDVFNIGKRAKEHRRGEVIDAAVTPNAAVMQVALKRHRRVWMY